MTMITQKPVCVTGASGFIASRIVSELLQKGYRVRGTVHRSPENYPHLLTLEGAKERLELVTADLLQKGSFNKAVEGCEQVMHTASPYVINVKNPQTDLVDPALKGTSEVMEACRAAGTVKRVVLTSSIAAITDEPDSSTIYTEKNWNTRSTLERNPYHFSKTLAERAAWEFVKDNNPGFDLVTINPVMVIGPSFSPALNTSSQMIRDIMTGVFPMIMDIQWGFVDVRDVARAHILAMEKPEAAGRYLCCADVMAMSTLVKLLREEGFGHYNLPKLDLTGAVGSGIMKVLSYTQPRDTGTYIRTNVGKRFQIDSGKIVRELGMNFSPLRTNILDTVRDMIAKGHLPSR